MKKDYYVGGWISIQSRNFLRFTCAGCPLAKSFGKSQNSGISCSVSKAVIMLEGGKL